MLGEKGGGPSACILVPPTLPSLSKPNTLPFLFASSISLICCLNFEPIGLITVAGLTISPWFVKEVDSHDDEERPCMESGVQEGGWTSSRRQERPGGASRPLSA